MKHLFCNWLQILSNGVISEQMHTWCIEIKSKDWKISAVFFQPHQPAPVASAFACVDVCAPLLAINMRLTVFMKKQWSGTSHERKQITKTLHYWWGASRMQCRLRVSLTGLCFRSSTAHTAWNTLLPEETAWGDLSVSLRGQTGQSRARLLCLTDVISAARHQVYLLHKHHCKLLTCCLSDDHHYCRWD